MKAYLDNGATTMTDPSVLKEMSPFYTETYGNPSSIHQAGQEAKRFMEEAREAVARKLNASYEEIIFTSGGTESDNLALKGVAFANREKGNHIITTKIEHPAVLKTCKFLEDHDFKVDYLDVDKEGFISLEDFENKITDKTILV